MGSLFEKVKENLLVTIVSLLMTAALVYVGSSFVKLQSSTEEMTIRLTAVETKLESTLENERRLDTIIANATIIDYLQKRIELLDERVRELEKR